MLIQSVQYTMWTQSCDGGSYTTYMDVKQEQFRTAKREQTAGDRDEACMYVHVQEEDR